MSVWEREMAMAHARAVVGESKGMHPPHPARTLSAGHIQVPPGLHPPVASSFAPSSTSAQHSDGFHKAVRVASRPQRKRFSGHVGDLSKLQEQALAQLRSLITDEMFRLAGKGNQDDYALLRFLRARDFDVYKAFMMFQNYALWRSQNNIDRVLDSKPPKLELIRKLLPHSHHGFDREGRPVLFEKTGQVDPGILLAMVSPQEYLQCHIYDQELLLKRCEEGSRRVGKVVETYVWVMDLTGVNISHRKGQALLQVCSQHDKEYFPERLGRLIIINPPWIFPAMYKLAAPLLDAKTKKKVTVIYGDASETLRSLIAPDQLPAEYGGECKCARKPGQLDTVWGCVPEYDLSKLREFQAELERRNRLPPEMQERLERDEKGDNMSQTSDEITIAAGAVYEMTFHIQTVQGSVAWCWSAAANDINFTVEYTCPRDPISQSPITVPSTGGSSSSSSQLQTQFGPPLSSGFPLSPASGALSPTSSPSPPTSPHMNRHPLPLRTSSSTHSSPSASPSPSRSPLPFTRNGSHFSPVLSSGPAQRRRAVEKKTALKVLRTDKHEGSFVSETGATTVKLIWDNTFSYFKSKTIRYRAAVIEDDPLVRERLAREADLAALAELQRDIEKLKMESLQSNSMDTSVSSSITDLPTLSRSSSGTVSRSSSGTLSSSSMASIASGTLAALGPSTALYTPPSPSPTALRSDLPPLPSPTSSLSLPRSAKPKGASSRSRNSSLSTLAVPVAPNALGGPAASLLINQNAWMPIGRERVLNHEELDLDFSSLGDHHEFVGKVFHSIL